MTRGDTLVRPPPPPPKAGLNRGSPSSMASGRGRPGAAPSPLTMAGSCQGGEGAPLPRAGRRPSQSVARDNRHPLPRRDRGGLETLTPPIVSRSPFPLSPATPEKRETGGDETPARRRDKRDRRGAPSPSARKAAAESPRPDTHPQTPPPHPPFRRGTAAHPTERRDLRGHTSPPPPHHPEGGRRTPAPIPGGPQPRRRVPTCPLRRSSHTPLPPSPPRTKAPNNGT